MVKWFEQKAESEPNIVSSRVRLVRNWDQYRFPKTLSDREGEELVKRLEFGLKNLEELDGTPYEYAYLEELDELSRRALRERRILNSAILNKKGMVGLIVSRDESVSLVLNGDDHIRMQFLSTGLCLNELWSRADKLDDYVNARFSYAFDEKYGYLTSFPTNVGTGLKASVTLHLPTLSLGKKFSSLVGEMSRFGLTLRGVYGEGSENYGSLFEIDGCGEFRMLVQIAIPLSTAVMAALGLFMAVGQWNAWFDALIYLQKNTDLYPLQLLLRNVFANANMGYNSSIQVDMMKNQTDTSLRMVVTMIGTVPILCVYPFLQKYFTSGVYMGAVKG